MTTALKMHKYLRGDRENFVEELRLIFERNSLFIVVCYKSLDTVSMDSLRRILRAKGAFLKVVKNTIMKLASSGLASDSMSQSFKGYSVAVIFSADRDPVNLAKIVCDFVEDDDRLSILGGIFERRTFNTQGIVNISKMPSMEQLYVDLLGLLMSPARSLINILDSPMGHLVRMLKSYSDSSKEGE